MIDLDDYPVLTQNSEGFLNRRQLLDYRSEREECLRWLLTFGKKPDEAIGCAEGTVKPRAYRMDRFYRFVWQQEGGYTVSGFITNVDSVNGNPSSDFPLTRPRNPGIT